MRRSEPNSEPVVAREWRRSTFSWPGRKRAAELERAADQAAERGLERLRARQRANAERASGSAPADAANEDTSAPAQPVEPPAAEPPAPQPPAPDLWESEFDRLADELITDLRHDLGPQPS